MTIEIKELIIRASVGNSEKTSSEAEGSGQAVDEQKLIRSCVEQVLDILKREKER